MAGVQNADGWPAATGVSAGKLNLHMIEVKPEQLETVVTDRKTGRELVFHFRPDFLRRYLNVPYEDQAKAAREVAQLSDAQIFDIAATKKR